MEYELQLDIYRRVLIVNYLDWKSAFSLFELIFRICQEKQIRTQSATLRAKMQAVGVKTVI